MAAGERTLVGVVKPEEGPAEKKESTEEDEIEGWIVDRAGGERKLSSTMPGER